MKGQRDQRRASRTQADRAREAAGDRAYMALALALAAKAWGRTSPNPMVGAVVVKGGRVVSTGYHRRAGGPHAEAIALRRAGKQARGATLYVTLEPCSHTNKRTPPCAPLVSASGVRRVVVAMIDPNPQVSGAGVRTLRKAGLEVTTGVLGQEARQLNEAFVQHVTERTPFVTLKIAQTLDGKIATAAGESQWITGKEARREAHRLRDRNDAILVGINTVLKDDPSLTARIPGGRDPVRVVVDSRLRIPLRAKLLTQRSPARTIVATLASSSRAKQGRLRALGAEVITTAPKQGRVDLRDLFRQLGRRDILSVLVEGGAETSASALQAGLVDKVVVFLAPLLLTGRDALCSVGGTCPDRLSRALRLQDVTGRFVGRDLMIEGYVVRGMRQSA